MKKAKVLLTAITVFAIVGGALAFKTKALGPNFLYTLNAAGDACNRVAPATTPGNTQGIKVTVIPDAGATTATADCQGNVNYDLE